MAKSQKAGTQAGEDIRADYGNKDGTNLNGNGGDDILRGGNYDDLLTGGQGNDKMFGGMGQDVFRFFGTDIVNVGGVPTGNEHDNIYDLAFRIREDDDLIGAGGPGGPNGSKGIFNDVILLQNFAEETANATLDSYEDIANLVVNSNWDASQIKANNLLLTYDFGDGVVQNIEITNGWSNYLAVTSEGDGAGLAV
jgi:hypothetical protein